MDAFQRLIVVGCCGAGKSTFAAQLASRLAIPYVERDALGILGSDPYRAAVQSVIQTPAWVFDGPPYYVDAQVYPAAQAVIWLDYPRQVVVWRAIRRAFRRTFAPAKPGQDRWERFRQWVEAGGPYFAWSVYAERKHEFAQLQDRPDLSGKVLHFQSAARAQTWLESLPL